MISEFIHTDLPMPVAPAISRCGIFAISKSIFLPVMSMPSAAVTLLFAFLNSSLSISVRRYTVETFLFGTSIPMALLPGITPEIRTAEARLSEISSALLIMAATFVPDSGAIS